MSSIDETKISADGIGHILSDKKLAVPPYQRSYSWDKGNVEQFFTDITSAFNEGEPEYFLGSIVLIDNGKGRLEIVDGQQRLATASIFIAVIKDYFNDKGESKRAETVQHKYLFSLDEVTMETEQHLIMNAGDNGAFEELIDKSNAKLPATAPRSVKHIHSTATLAREQIVAIEKISKDPVETLAKLLGYIKDKVRVICVTVPDESNAFAIFETLNDRGLALSVADLLKNYIFGKSGKKIEEAKTQWATLVGILNTVGDESLLPSFIRHFWASHYGPATEKELFKKIKARIHTSKEAIDLIELLIKNAKNYAALLNPDHDKWLKLNSGTQEAVKVLADMRMEQTRPLLLAILSNFSDNETKKTIKKSVDWSVRLLVAGNTRTGQFSKTLSEISIAISERRIKDTKALTKEIGRIIPGKTEFIEAFEGVTPSRQMARYYLMEIEKKKRAKAGETTELVPSYSTDEVNLEHILPQTVTDKDWPNFDDESARENFNKLGNLTLMNAVENSGLGNVPFKDKKALYTKSKFMITKEIDAFKDWGVKTIAKRQKEMASLASSIWPL